ncbi:MULTISPECIES: flagellar protein FliT [Bacillus]|uniref:Flagellar protein FliT n=1 Tax=Bacillus glycinifermentans TaxID=1664069 RepID=A0AAJ3Z1X1_9BACI|nr:MULTISPECIES: flagellar protein FliT [Bacillus]KKB75080.1 flagellar assembly protein FliT [Bacillus sp. TH008]MBU8787525.1 flagellar protein FliT [Bacillus glycinifermentans]MDU0070381.1 flagellar protein FliT [Bacillus sp. IG6]MED8018177.1 flagellar protein FliT [Bacillus glycinifermentans]NUJ16334.1 flagellar protein FliT [Bacillus glycinifermentans]
MGKAELLYNETKNMLAKVKDAPESDELLQAIEDFLQKRDGLIKEIKPPLSHEEKLEMKKVLELEPLVAAELKRLQQDIKKELLQAKKKRTLHQTYRNPYNNITIDGTYYDKRK